MPDPYEVHDVMVSDVPVFNQRGGVDTKTRVTFYAGAHGPFTFDLDPAQATASVINSRITDRVRELRMITGATS